MPKAHYKFSGLGKRKTAVARVYMNAGTGSFEINGRPLEEYFPTKIHQMSVQRPLKLLDQLGKLDIHVRVLGGGVAGQADAVAHGISRALLEVDETFRPKLKVEGLLTRDARKKERKKYGQPGARKRFQYSKR